jgi:AmiR/NasT family two-component response regulator
MDGNTVAMSERTAKLAQAQGIITVQADCTLDEALSLMLARAQTANQGLIHIAEAVIAHRIWFGKV